MPTSCSGDDAAASSMVRMGSVEDDTSLQMTQEVREVEYPQLKDKIYLDHGGTTLYAKSCIDSWAADMTSNLYGNPHSDSTPSAQAGHRIDTIRERTLRFFNANPKYWDLVFVANATAAIKLVGECLRDNAVTTKTPFWYGYHKDAHTSIVGVRELAKANRCFANDTEVDQWIMNRCPGIRHNRHIGLFAYPGQSNMTGRRLPLRWSRQIRQARQDHNVYTLLDAAAFASTASLDLYDLDHSPDFVALSFYKIFGWPNVGALLVQRRSQHLLERRKFFGGGTVEMIIAVGDRWHAKKSTSIHDRLEDGTLPFHSIFALDHAIDTHERLYGPDPMKRISTCTAQLGKTLYDALRNLKHSNGQPLMRIYKDQNAHYGDSELQGATIALNVLRADGSVVGYADVEKAADEKNIFVRSGSLCNPGGLATYLEWSPSEMKAAYDAGHRCSDPTQVMFGKPTGVVRVSLGAMSVTADVQAFVTFVQDTYCDAELDLQVTIPKTILSSAGIKVSLGAVLKAALVKRKSIRHQTRNSRHRQLPSGDE